MLNATDVRFNCMTSKMIVYYLSFQVNREITDLISFENAVELKQKTTLSPLVADNNTRQTTVKSDTDDNPGGVLFIIT